MERRKDYVVNVSIEKLRSVLLDMELYGEYHPLIKSVSQGKNKSHFLINEKPIYFLPFRVKYAVSV